MSLKDQIKEDVKTAMRAKDKPRLGTLRLLLAAIQRKEVDERITLDDTQVLSVLEKTIKQSRDAHEQFVKGDRKDLAEKELADIAVWEVYLPQQLAAEEVEKLVAAAVAESGASSIKEMGKVMAILKPKIQGQADMGQVSTLVKAKLQ
jgi:uncharacterized protein YqeY